jgi:HD-GYP domain-containing protein (c-di-GMP phosphodiesterase class II)
VRPISISLLKPGARLARDVVTGRPGDLPLLRAGSTVSARYREALVRHGIHAVYVEDDISEGIDVSPVLTERTRQEATNALARAFEDAPQLLAARKPLPPGIVSQLERVVQLIASDIAHCGDSALAFHDMLSADAYTLQHSIDVTALGLLLGQRLFREHGWVDYRGDRAFGKLDEKLARLGLGLILHDIGKLTIPAHILHKPGALDAAEMELVRQHPIAGWDMLNSDLISPLAKGVVRWHHERWDGQGYPDGRVGERIPQMARIASVSDVFDAITSERSYRGAAPASAGVRAILAGSGSAFDPEVVEIFQRVVAPYPPGSEVTLSDGSRGLVAAAEHGRFDRPVVRIVWGPDGEQVDPYEIDLDQNRDLKIIPAEVPPVTQPEPIAVDRPRRLNQRAMRAGAP